MQVKLIVVTLLVGSNILSGCGQRSDIASTDCTELTAGRLSESQQIELAKKCPRAGPPFKPSPARNW
jgi:entry exclusion lipoprotein TrbK